MSTRTGVANSVTDSPARRRRLWRYGPLLVWITFIFIASSAELSAGNTSKIVRPLLLWLFPHVSEEKITLIHFFVRKAAHFTEYAILALLALRAFLSSSRARLRRHWFLFSLALVILMALTDELHQAFVPSRTGSIYDSMIDTAGGLTALTIYALRRKK